MLRFELFLRAGKPFSPREQGSTMGNMNGENSRGH